MTGSTLRRGSSEGSTSQDSAAASREPAPPTRSWARRAASRLPVWRRLRDANAALLAERRLLSEKLARLELEHATLTSGEQSPFFHYHASFDALGAIHRHAVPDLEPVAGYVRNFLGVLVDHRILPTVLGPRGGQVEAIPIPANWHADIAEWAAALRAVDLARDSFTVIELGCGWGCWMNNTGAAARRAGLEVRLVGIEGDAGHVAFARETCAANGFAPAQVTLHHGVAAGQSGTALFPRQQRGGGEWNLQPNLDATDEQRRAASRTGSDDALPMIPLAELAASLPRIDLLHVDIQGGEAALIAECLPTLDEKVAYLVVGTHSRQIEGSLFDTLLRSGWQLEIERPAILSIKPLAGTSNLSVAVDGVQGWRNPRLLP